MYEEQAHAQGYQRVAGLDEAGRGPWAGPLVAAAVILPDVATLPDQLKGARDSKQMTHRQRARLAEVIKQVALAYGVGVVSADEIVAHGLGAALRLAYQRALDACDMPADFLLIDHTKWPQQTLPHLSITHGDQLSLSIACASILAKIWRDQHMIELHTQHPVYGFDRNKGYGTAQHSAAIQAYGIVQGVHRLNVRPVAQALLL
jgi:ribonuclease HII